MKFALWVLIVKGRVADVLKLPREVDAFSPVILALSKLGFLILNVNGARSPALAAGRFVDSIDRGCIGERPVTSSFGLDTSAVPLVEKYWNKVGLSKRTGDVVPSWKTV